MPHAPREPENSEDTLDSPDLHSAERALEILRASQKLIHLGRMTASITHEVNNPLEAVSNLLYLIRMEGGLSKDSQTYLDHAEREMERVISISRQTLNFARESTEPVEVSLLDVLEDVLILYRRRIHEKQLRIVRRYTPTEPIHALPGEMRQILSNLIINAIEACSLHGIVTVRVRPAYAAHGLKGIRITIADDGTGIPSKARHRLGEAFFTTKGQGGTGLGLWVTRSIIERYGGHLRLRSAHIAERHGKTRHGTVFALFLPAVNGPRMRTVPGAGSRPVIVSRNSRPVHQIRDAAMRRTGNDG